MVGGAIPFILTAIITKNPELLAEGVAKGASEGAASDAILEINKTLDELEKVKEIPAAEVDEEHTVILSSENMSESPEILPHEITGKTRTQIRQLAKEKGLVPKGDKSNPDYPRKWNDPVTKKMRLRLDRGHIDADGSPYKNPNAAVDHAHAYDKNGRPILDLNLDKHFPTNDE